MAFYVGGIKSKISSLLLELSYEIDKAWKSTKDEDLKDEARNLYGMIWDFREKL